ncbi:aminotransferase class I/II-fold pyridoxal phosphate-dependent enzyme [Salinimonas iocasae]|uniref:cysteine-S-conjugate beta-lyase n=1 Tax=Salinimonas iocasae TaxID=2572577 RepID=A0A5B7YCJ6_9ALTE|nr:aminotransferase class I/II-fold pyridoxal phosphate-dependent enzyme [Salinimonas iocasae]QCZ93422.1 aminotransferase class I/II-fold pyridoxal phosphate-dependent enzyme [Salinimonas iocasae]
MSVFIERQGTGSLKYDGVECKFGVTYPDMVSMWIADMDVALPPAIQNTVNHYISSSAVGYQSVPVAPAVVRWLAKGGTYIEPEWVVPCNGVLSTIFLSVTLYSEPDSKVAVIAPTYSPLYDAVRDSGRNLQVVSTLQNEDGEWSLDITAIDPQSSMLLMCNPQNPTGHVWRPDQLAEIADYCRQHSIMIICDEIHADFMFEQPFTSFVNASIDSTENIIVLRSASKSFNLAGIDNAAYAVCANNHVRDVLNNALDRRHLVPSPLACRVLNTAYSRCDDWFFAVLSAISANRMLLVNARGKLPDTLRLHVPRGTYFALLDARTHSENPADTLLHDYHLALGSGDPEFAPGFFRLNLSTSTENIEALIARLTICSE